MATKYRNRNDFKYPSGPMLCNIEESILFLVQQAKDNNLDLDKTFNHMTKDGTTLFFYASIFSEKITRQLLNEEVVRVNSIDLRFVTPFFRVRLKVDF